jgi:uncharacterized protein YjbI with pentapeptide repeats
MLGLVLSLTTLASAHIYEWELNLWGKQQSTTICPDGTDVDAVPDAELSNLDLTKAWLYDKNLTDASFENATLTNAYLMYADLTRTNFTNATLTDADFTDATVTGVGFSDTTSRGFTAAQLYSTANYKNGDLSGIRLTMNDLTDWNFAGKNCTNAGFSYATLTNADFTNAIVTGASFNDTTSQGFTAAQLYSTASYKNGDLSGIKLMSNDLTGWNFAGQNLTGAIFSYSTLTNTDFTDAIVTEANFGNAPSHGFTADQLYSTASYKNGDLRKIWLYFNDLTGWNFAGQNLTGAIFCYSNLTNANLSDANLINANFGEAILINTNLSRTDLRGSNAYFMSASFFPDFSAAVTNNMIRPDGRIEGLNLSDGETLKIRDFNQDYLGNSMSIPIQIENEMALASEAVLRMIFTDAEWGSTISFDDGIAVNLDGLLDLTFADGVNPADLVGTTFDLFNWDGVSPAGGFISILDHGLVWDTGNLYTTGEVTLLAVPEPAMLSFLILGGLPLLRRRRV